MIWESILVGKWNRSPILVVSDKSRRQSRDRPTTNHVYYRVRRSPWKSWKALENVISIQGPWKPLKTHGFSPCVMKSPWKPTSKLQRSCSCSAVQPTLATTRTWLPRGLLQMKSSGKRGRGRQWKTSLWWKNEDFRVLEDLGRCHRPALLMLTVISLCFVFFCS